MTTLYEELTTDPENLGYAALIASDNDEAIANILNTKNIDSPASRIITARGILSDYPGGPIAAATLLDKLDEAATPAIPALKWAWKFITGEGIDIGHSAVHGMLNNLATASIITTEEATNLKSLSYIKKSRAEILFGKPVAVTEIAALVRDDEGNRLIGA